MQQLGGPTSGNLDFLGVGHLAVDESNGASRLGGAAAYACLTASRLGLSAGMVTAVGDDFDLFGPLVRESIEVHYHREGSSTTFRNVDRGTTRHQQLLGRARPLNEDDLVTIRPRLAESTVVLYCPIAREVEMSLVPITRSGLCGVAPQGFFRDWDEKGAVSRVGWKGAAASLSRADVVSLSEADVSDTSELTRWAGESKRADGGSRLLIVTEAERGVRLYAGTRGVRIPACPADEVEPTGAGDVLVASFLVALREGQRPLEAAQFACCAASFAVERAGIDGVPTSRQAIDQRLQDYRGQRFRPEELSG